MGYSAFNDWENPVSYLTRMEPDDPICFFSAQNLTETFNMFCESFDGTVTYAVKANPESAILDSLALAGMRAYDVASVAEMRAVRDADPKAILHYHNPVRSDLEIEQAKHFGIKSWSIDDMVEFEKLGDLPNGTEISVRFALDVKGAAYDFGAKFGASPDQAIELLKVVFERGYIPSLTFHPGTQCPDIGAWAQYMEMAREIARQAKVELHRLNVGGGFPAHRYADKPDVAAILRGLSELRNTVFDADARPELVCEPGRSMVSGAIKMGLKVKAVRKNDAIILNDGIYGSLSEWRDMPAMDKCHVSVFSSKGELNTNARKPMTVYGPTCDSLDRLPEQLALPCDIECGDYVIFDNMGAYSASLTTNFNGYGRARVIPCRF